jgi:hypothetical protein
VTETEQPGDTLHPAGTLSDSKFSNAGLSGTTFFPCSAALPERFTQIIPAVNIAHIPFAVIYLLPVCF